MSNNRINWLLILQGWAMLWVVIGHAPLGEVSDGPIWVRAFYKFAYSFHMPLFMLVSGWLFYRTRLGTGVLMKGGQKWSYNQIVRDKVIRLLLPGLVFSGVAFAMKIAFPGEASRQVGLSFYEIAHAFLYPYDNPLRELWFIATLFWFFLMTPIWRVLMRTEWMMWPAIALLTVFHFWYPDIELLCIGRVFAYAIWFYMGLVISKTELVEQFFVKFPWMTLFVGVFIYVVGRHTNEFITTLGGIVLSFGIAMLLDKHYPQTFCSFRDYTYQIFLIGIFAQILVKILYRHFDLPYLPTYLLCIAVGLYIPVVVSMVVKKINYRPLLLCVGLK